MSNYFLISLGCAKNRVDSEVVLADLDRLGLTRSDRADQADVVIVNTCSFIQPAVEESIDHLLEAAQLKEAGRTGAVVCLGCLPERYGRELVDEMDEIDLFIPSGALDRAAELIVDLMERRPTDRLVGYDQRRDLPAAADRILTTAPGSAYLKISEGCPNHCTYCTIPAIRGPQRSRNIEDAVAEAAGLARAGVREINLVAQDLTAFGQDLDRPAELVDLLTALEEVEPGPDWIRLLYLNPGLIDDRLLERIASSRRILPYLDIPLQHLLPRLIKKMGRRPPEDDPIAWLGRLREAVPGAALRTTIMVGFPGETDRDFEELLDLVARARFDRLGCFAYSPEEGTPAATMPGAVDPETALERQDRLMELQGEISRELNQALVGSEIDVLIEGEHPESDLLLIGRAWSQAPEVDGQTIIAAGVGSPGTISPALVVEAHEHDLVVHLPEP